MKKRTICLALACAFAIASHAENWPRYRGPEMNGLTAEKNLPAKWSSSKNRVWKLELPGAGTSQPVTSGNRIYVTSYSGYGEKRSRKADKTDPAKLMLHVLCLNADDGSVIWRKDINPLGSVVEYKQASSKHGYATPTPLIEGDSLYVSFGTAGVFALNPEDGSEKWKMVPGDICHRWGCAASLVTCGDLLLVNASSEANALIALDKATGKEKWRNNEAMLTKSKSNRSWSTPMVMDNPEGGKQILLLNLQAICAYNPADGKTLWTYPTRQGYSASNPIIHENIIYAITGSGHGTWNSYALKPAPSIDRKSREIWHNENNGTGFSSAVYVDGYIYYAAFTNKERPTTAVGFCCMDAKTGEMVYKEKKREEFPDLAKRGNVIYAAALAGDGKIYYVSTYGGIFVFEAKPKLNILSVNKFEDDNSCFNAPVIPLTGGRLLLRSDWGLHCVGEK